MSIRHTYKMKKKKNRNTKTHTAVLDGACRVWVVGWSPCLLRHTTCHQPCEPSVRSVFLRSNCNIILINMRACYFCVTIIVCVWYFLFLRYFVVVVFHIHLFCSRGCWLVVGGSFLLCGHMNAVGRSIRYIYFQWTVFVYGLWSPGPQEDGAQKLSHRSHRRRANIKRTYAAVIKCMLACCCYYYFLLVLVVRERERESGAGAFGGKWNTHVDCNIYMECCGTALGLYM